MGYIKVMEVRRAEAAARRWWEFERIKFVKEERGPGGGERNERC